MKEVSDYYKKTKNFITFEYVLLAGVNDHHTDAEELKQILAPMNCKLNLIPYNEVQELSKFKRPSNTRLLAFYKTLKNELERNI